MRMPYPFTTPVDPEAEDVAIKVMVDMPNAHNLTVHLANEHGTGSGAHGQDERSMLHLRCHLYGEFRAGSEHYHVRGEFA